MVFAGYSGFFHYLQLASHELATIGINVTKNEITNSKYEKRRHVTDREFADMCAVENQNGQFLN